MEHFFNFIFIIFFLLEIFRFPFQIRGKYLVDWSTKNEIVMAIDEGTGVFNADSPSSLSYLSYLGSDDDITVVKWNNSGGYKYFDKYFAKPKF